MGESTKVALTQHPRAAPFRVCSSTLIAHDADMIELVGVRFLDKWLSSYVLIIYTPFGPLPKWISLFYYYYFKN